MAAFNFPNSPSTNDIHTENGISWKWNGTVWKKVASPDTIAKANSKVQVVDAGTGGYITAETDGTQRLRVQNSGAIVTGILTATSFNVGTAGTISSAGNITLDKPGAGIITATSFSGSGVNLTSLNGSNISSGTVATARLGSGTANNSVFLRGDSSWAAVTQTTINNNANNRVITGSGTANTLEGESNLTFDGSDLSLRATKSNLIVAKTGLTVKANSDLATSYDLIQLGAGGALASYSTATATADTHFIHNAYRHSGNNWKYRYADTAARLRVNSPARTWIFESAASGSADGDITFVEQVRIDSSGSVRIGNTTQTFLSAASNLVVGNGNGSRGMTIYSGSGDGGFIAFADGTSDPAYRMGQIIYDHSANGMLFRTNGNNNRLTIDSGGKLWVDRTHASATTGDHPALDIDTYANGTAGATFSTGIDFRVAGVHKKRLAVTNVDSSVGTGDWIFYRDNGTNEALRITSDGKIGIGNNPDAAVMIKLTGQVADGSDDASDWGAAGIVNMYNTDGGTTGSEILLLGSQTSGVGQLSSGFGFGRQSASTWGTYISFKMHPDGTSNIDSIMERARFTPAGYFLTQGNASNYHDSNNTIFHQFNNWQNYSWVLNCRNWGTGYGIRVQTASNSSGREALYVYDTANSVGKAAIYMNGNYGSSSNTYGAMSDIKLKENIVDANSQWDDIKALKVRNFNFKIDDPSEKMLGLIAQEAEAVCPSLVWDQPEKEEDSEGKMTETGEVTKQLKYSILYMKAVKCLQEAQARIETLEAKVASLESS